MKTSPVFGYYWSALKSREPDSDWPRQITYQPDILKKENLEDHLIGNPDSPDAYWVNMNEKNNFEPEVYRPADCLELVKGRSKYSPLAAAAAAAALSIVSFPDNTPKLYQGIQKA